MSRFALDWAKKQQPGSVEGKAALLILGDRAQGANNTCELFEWVLADLASLDQPKLPTLIQDLESRGYISATVQPPPLYTAVMRQNRNYGNWIKFDLLIADDEADPAAPHPSIGGDNEPHAVYRLYDSKGVLLYVGESSSPERRFIEHQMHQPWWFEVATREITWHPNKVIAKAEELRGIRLGRPVYNIKDSPTPPAGDSKPQKRRYIKDNARRDAFTHVLGCLRSDLRAGRFDVMPLPTVDDLTKRHHVGWMLIKQVLNELLKTGEIAYIKDPNRPLGGIYVRDWSEW